MSRPAAERGREQMFLPPAGEDSKCNKRNIRVFAKEFCVFGCNKSATGSATKCNKVQQADA